MLRVPPIPRYPRVSREELLGECGTTLEGANAGACRESEDPVWFETASPSRSCGVVLRNATPKFRSLCIYANNGATSNHQGWLRQDKRASATRIHRCVFRFDESFRRISPFSLKHGLRLAGALALASSYLPFPCYKLPFGVEARAGGLCVSFRSSRTGTCPGTCPGTLFMVLLCTW